jgi:hypothetical protein
MIRRFIEKTMTLCGVAAIIGIIQFELFSDPFFMYVALALCIPMFLAILIDFADRLGRYKKGDENDT